MGLQVIDDLIFVFACLCNCFCVLACALRVTSAQRVWLDQLKQNAFGMYLVHYVFVTWLQYSLLPVGSPALVKAGTVFVGTLVLSWGSTAAFRHLPSVAAIIAGGWRAPVRPL